MLNKKIFRSKWLVWGVIWSVSLLFFPGEALAQAKSGALLGFIYAADMVSPVAGAVVKLRNVTDGKELQSGPTDKNGMYALKDIAAGRYEIGISAEAGDFNFAYQLQVKAAETAKLAMALTPGGVNMAQGQDANKKKKKRGGFFWSPLGIAAIVGAAGLLVYGGFKLFAGKDEDSPSTK